MNSIRPKEPIPHAVDISPASAKPLVRPRQAFRLWHWLAALISGLFLFYGTVGYWGSAQMIGEHPRWRGMNRGPQDFGLKGEIVSFRSQDGISLKAWWLPAEGKPRASVIVAHGIDHTRQAMLPRATFLVRGGYNVLAIDLRGHGESDGQYVSPGYLEVCDILGAIQYVRGRGEHEPIAVLGVSYGAVAALLGVRVTSSASQIEVLLSSAAARIEGAVLDGDQHGVKAAYVIAVPEGDLRKDIRNFRNGTSDQNGHFSLRGVKPGHADIGTTLGIYTHAINKDKLLAQNQVMEAMMKPGLVN